MCQRWPCHQVPKDGTSMAPGTSGSSPCCLVSWVWDSTLLLTLLFSPFQKRFLIWPISWREGDKKLSEMGKVNKQIEQEKAEVQVALKEAEVLHSGSKEGFYHCDEAGLHSSSNNRNAGTYSYADYMLGAVPRAWCALFHAFTPAKYCLISQMRTLSLRE